MKPVSTKNISPLLSIVVCIFIIYSFGVFWLMWWSAIIAGKPLSFLTALSVGALPFIAFDIIKGIAAYFIVKAMPKNIRCEMQSKGEAFTNNCSLD